MNIQEIDKKLGQVDADIAISRVALTEATQTLSSTKSDWWSTTDAMTISSIILIFGIIVMFLATSLIRSGKSSDSVLSIFGTILIIVASVFLVVAGYSDQQIAPVIGLLGTIAGYLLGKNSRE